MINSSSKADETYTVDQFVDMKSSDEITYYNFSILGYLSGIEISMTSILYDYQDELDDLTKVLILKDAEMRKYMYKPWLLAYDIYGSTETSFIIMILNGILSDSEFNFDRIKVLAPNDLNTILGRIYSANQVYINNNRSDIALEEKNDNRTDWVW